MDISQKPARLYDGYTYWVVRMARTMRQNMAKCLARHNLNERVLGVLMSIQGSHRDTPSAIANYMDVDRSIVTRTLREMQERGLITFDRNEQDGRSRKLHLTEAGLELLELGTQCAHDNNHYFASKMPEGMDEDIRILFRGIVEAEQNAPPNQPLLAQHRSRG